MSFLGFSRRIFPDASTKTTRNLEQTPIKERPVWREKGCLIKWTDNLNSTPPKEYHQPKTKTIGIM